MKNSKIHIIVGARPNFMKAAPVLKALDDSGLFETALIHTGQHYDINMSDIFFTDLEMRLPDRHLGVGQGTQGQQLAKIILAYEEVIAEDRPDYVVVCGDVTSTLAATLAAAKNDIPVGHIEAGLRSYDETMPEELNRVLTDRMSDLLWTPSPDANENLRKEGIDEGRIAFVGNIMIDTLELLKDKALAHEPHKKFDLDEKSFGLVTIHRPGNVDDPDSLKQIFEILQKIAKDCPLIFPVHPRTRKAMEEAGLDYDDMNTNGLHLADPMGYLDFTSLLHRSKFVITDSGGLQEETTYLGIPCMTLRPNTERPVTIDIGTNKLVTLDTLYDDFQTFMNGNWKDGRIPDLWDGKTAARIVESLKERLGLQQEQRKTA